MSNPSRREFFERSLLSAAAAVVAANACSGTAQAVETAAGSTAANEKLGVALIGAGVPGRGRGTNGHLPFYCRRPDTELLWIVDADQINGQAAIAAAAKIQGRAPKFARDMREALADPAVDVVSIATPHHWHALAAIWAMQAGKDVYVEKPVSHNVSEGRRMIEAARKYNKICQTGTQCRSMPGLRDAIAYLHRGDLGEVKLARAVCYKRRGSIRALGSYPIPPSLNYGLWLGPAPEAPLTWAQLHYDWHWQWPYGNGDLGNQGAHQMDVARWGLGEAGLNSRVVSYGGRVGYEENEAGQTPNTQVVMHDYGDKTLICEVRGLESESFPCPDKHARLGVIFASTDGRMLVVPNYNSAVAYDKDGQQIQAFTGNPDESVHFVNFLEAVRSRKVESLNADIREGHVSAALCHLGNISYLLGKPATLEEVEKGLPDIGGAAARETFERTKTHLDQNDLDLDKVKFALGAVLQFDATREEFVGNAAANRLLTREYRQPFVVPAQGQV